jgi:hypothetical protein
MSTRPERGEFASFGEADGSNVVNKTGFVRMQTKPVVFGFTLSAS